MKKDDIDFIRQFHGELKEKTGDEIEEAKRELTSLPAVPDLVRIANYMILRDLRATLFPERPKVLFFYDPSKDLLWLNTCEMLFINNFYGPCCIWARSTVEFLLQELCLSHNGVRSEFKDKIKRPGLNPGIDECLEELKGVVSEDFEKHCKAIKNIGNHIVHHRLDSILSEDKMKDYLNQWEVREDVFCKIFSHEDGRLLQRTLMPKSWSECAQSSMEHLYAAMQILVRV